MLLLLMMMVWGLLWWVLMDRKAIVRAGAKRKDVEQ